MNRENRTISLLTPPACTPEYKILSDAAIHDLGLDYICGQITEKKSEQTLCLSILSKMMDNAEVTRYRSDVFSDIYQNEAMRDEMLRILDKINFLRDYGSIGRTFEESAGIWDLMHRLDELKDYIQCVEAIFKSLSDASVHSEGLLCLQRYIDDLYHDNGFLELREAAEERMMLSFHSVDCIYTHFPADEDKTMDLGRLGEECRRFRQIYSDSTKNSLLLLNETFSTTSFEEGYFIAKDAVKAILEKGIRTIYNTHMHKLAFDLEELNRYYDSVKAVSLIVKADGGNRSFKIAMAPPEGMSYAGDIARKYGVTYEMLVNQITVHDDE